MQIKGRILHFIGRKAMNVLAGEASVEQFYNAGLVRTPADLYDINKYQLMSLEGWQDRSAQRFLDSLAASVDVPFERVLFALGIRFVGETTARDLARHFGDIDSLAAASVEDLLEVAEVGDVIARSVYDYILYRRVMLARQMMMSDLSLNAIAYQCGFNDYSNFLRMFRKMIGVSPSQFRKGLRAGAAGEAVGE